MLDLAIAEQKIVIANLCKREEILVQYHLFDGILSVNLEINKKTLELIHWESSVLEINNAVVTDKAEREEAAKSIVNGIKEKLAQLFYRKAHIQKVRKDLDKKIQRNKHLQQSAADELDSMLSQIAL